MSNAVRDILAQIEILTQDDRLNLAEQLLELPSRVPAANGQHRYPLRGSVRRYDDPTEPVAEGDWEAAS